MTVSYAIASDAFELVDYYHKYPKFHDYFDQILKLKSPDVIRFRGRPLRMYIHALAELDPANKKLYKQVAYGKELSVKQDAISQILNRYERDSTPYEKLGTRIRSLATDKEDVIFTDEEHKEIEQAHKQKEPQRTQSYLKFLNKKDGNGGADFTPPTKNEAAEVVDKVVKDLESQTVIKAQQGIVKAEQAASGLGSSLLKGVRNTVSGGASLAGRGGLSALDHAANLAAGRGASGLASVGASAASKSLMLNPIFWVSVIVLLVLLLFIFPMLQKGSALFPPYDQATSSDGSNQPTPSTTLPTNPFSRTTPAEGLGGMTKTAQDLVDVYFGASGGFTYAIAPFEPLRSLLTNKNYSTEILGSFAIRRQAVGGCAECLGFVALSQTLLQGELNTFTLNRAADYFDPQSFVSAGTSFVRVSTESIQPGDIGVTRADSLDPFVGHILIVKTASADSPLTFTGLESSYPFRCQVNDKQNHDRRKYNFFRGETL